MKNSFLVGNIPVSGYNIPQVATELNFSDFMGAVMVRWGINRDNYRVSPGLYAVGTPTSESDVFVITSFHSMHCGKVSTELMDGYWYSTLKG